jgi:hypothetical protein
MGLVFRKRARVGPFVFNLSRRGVSHAVRVGALTYNRTRRTASVNLPGPFSFRWRTKR